MWLCCGQWPGDNLLNDVDVVHAFSNYSGRRDPFPGWLVCVVPWIRGEEGVALVVDMHIQHWDGDSRVVVVVLASAVAMGI